VNLRIKTVQHLSDDLKTHKHTNKHRSTCKYQKVPKELRAKELPRHYDLSAQKNYPNSVTCLTELRYWQTLIWCSDTLPWQIQELGFEGFPFHFLPPFPSLLSPPLLSFYPFPLLPSIFPHNFMHFPHPLPYMQSLLFRSILYPPAFWFPLICGHWVWELVEQSNTYHTFHMMSSVLGFHRCK